METEKKNYIRRSDLFLANTVHELRTPVQTIIGTLDLLSDTKLNTEQTEYVKQLKFSSEVLLSLVNDILDFAKLHTDQISIEEISFNPILLLENTASLVSLDASEKGIELFTDIDYSLYPEISGDPTRIRQIILNLLKNAVKFTEKGYVKIKMQKIADFLEFSVTDTGIGIKPEYKEKLFTNFWQGDPSITRKYGGTGLGLSICKSLITKMNGEIYVNENPDGGSIFTFEIKGDAKKAQEFIDNLELFSLLANVADVKSLAIHPASTTHSECNEAELLDQGIKPNTIRLSIGTENINDIIEDLDEAFKALS